MNSIWNWSPFAVRLSRDKANPNTRWSPHRFLQARPAASHGVARSTSQSQVGKSARNLSGHLYRGLGTRRRKHHASAHKFEEVVVLVGQQGFLLAFHVADRPLEETVLFAYDFIEERNRLPALCRAFHSRRHERVIEGFWCCLPIGPIAFAVVFLLVSPAVKTNRGERGRKCWIS